MTPISSSRPSSSQRAFGLNPVWTKEILHVLRLRRTPFFFCGVAIVVTLLVCALGALSSLNQEPFRVGSLVYQSFFTLAFGLVLWIAPGVAASMIANERTAPHWDVLTASGVSPATVVRGKFAAALTTVLLCLMISAPISLLSLVLGGVTPGEVATALSLLVLTAMLAVGFGLSIGSALSSVTLALMLSVTLGVLLSIAAYLVGTSAASLATTVWGIFAESTPFWLPTVLSRAHVDLSYVSYLIAMPLAIIAFVLWFFYEVTISNLTESSQDRTTRLRYWFTSAALVLYTSAVVGSVTLGRARWLGYWITFGVIATVSLMGLFVFAGDALVPSTRVTNAWQRRGASPLRRFFGPGIVKAVISVVLLALAGVLLLASVVLFRDPDLQIDTRQNLMTLLGTGSYVVGFMTFLAGFTAFVRSRSQSGTMPRLLLAGTLLAVTVGPVLIAGATALIGGFADDALAVIGVPSPAYLVFMIIAVETSSASTPLLLSAAFVTAAIWLLVGAVLLWSTQRRIMRGRVA